MFRKEAKKVMCSVVTIISYKDGTPSFGSGFVIKTSDDASVVMTCKHCVQHLKPNDDLRIRYVVKGAVRELPAAVLFISGTDVDVALITVDGLTALPPLRFSELNMFVGQNVVTFGTCMPSCLWEDEDEWAIPKFHGSCPGVVRGFRSKTVVWMKGVALSGMSGSPTLSRRGVSAMLTGGVPGYAVYITTEGIKVALGMFLTNRNIQFRGDFSIHQMLNIMPLR